VIRRLRFGLLYHPAGLEGWHVRCLEELDAVADLAWAVAAPRSVAASHRSRALDRYAARVGPRRVVYIPDRLAHAPSHGMGGETDLVLGLGDVAVPPGLAARARLGVWRFEHETTSSPLPLLEEVYRGNDVTHVALLAHGADGRISALDEGVFRTDKRSYRRHCDAILDAVAPWPARALRRFSEPSGAAAPSRPAMTTGATARPPSVLLLSLKLAARNGALAWERLFRHPQWNVGILRRPVEELLEPGAYTGEGVDWFPLEGKEGFLADPFAVDGEGGMQVLCEYFDYGTSTGRVRALELAREGFGTGTDVFSPGIHVSYPFVLDLPGGIYCVPETAEAGEVALYRVAQGPEPWEKVAVLLDGFPGVDPTVFRHDGRWWLACTRAGPQEDSELWVWHAPAIEGPWSGHALNPVKTDVRCARPAGPPFVHRGVLYRPAQDCSRTYGGRVTLQRVRELTPTAFAEETVNVIEASARSRYPIGPHTVTAVGDSVLVDGRRMVFVPAACRAFVRIWTKRAVARLTRR
jgi:hypothetical protein